MMLHTNYQGSRSRSIGFRQGATFLKMGTILASLESSGTVPEFSDFWNILVSAGASSSAAILRINVVMVSGPASYIGFKFFSSLMTPGMLTVMFFMVG